MGAQVEFELMGRGAEGHRSGTATHWEREVFGLVMLRLTSRPRELFDARGTRGARATRQPSVLLTTPSLQPAGDLPAGTAWSAVGSAYLAWAYAPGTSSGSMTLNQAYDSCNLVAWYIRDPRCVLWRWRRSPRRPVHHGGSSAMPQ